MTLCLSGLTPDYVQVVRVPLLFQIKTNVRLKMADVSTFVATLSVPIIARVSKVTTNFCQVLEKSFLTSFQATFCTRMTMIAKREDVNMKSLRPVENFPVHTTLITTRPKRTVFGCFLPLLVTESNWYAQGQKT